MFDLFTSTINPAPKSFEEKKDRFPLYKYNYNSNELLNRAKYSIVLTKINTVSNL